MLTFRLGFITQRFKSEVKATLLLMNQANKVNARVCGMKVLQQTAMCAMLAKGGTLSDIAAATTSQHPFSLLLFES
jgi:hypothetical protein